MARISGDPNTENQPNLNSKIVLLAQPAAHSSNLYATYEFILRLPMETKRRSRGRS